jgi:protoporphyrinogen oxidase
MFCPSRREVLEALLGLPALAATGPLGCCRKPIPAGEIVGADVAVGHLLRDSGRPSAPVTSRESIPVVIVGAGIAGLSAAWRLAQSPNTPYVVLELEDCAGGTSRSSANAITAFPWGAHYVPVPMASNRALVRLLSEMGVVTGTGEDGEPLVAEEHRITEPEERVFYRGSWHEGLLPEPALTAEDRAQMSRFRDEIARWVGWRDGQRRRGFVLPIDHGSEDPEVLALDRITMAEWMDRLALRSPALRWYVDYACRDDYGCRLDTTSAWAGVFYFASRVRRPGGASAPLLAWPEGNGRIAAHLNRSAGARVRTRQLVHDIIPHDDHVEVVVTDARSQRVASYVAQQVIVAVPRFIAARLLRPWRDHPPSELAEFETAPWLVANLSLRDRPANQGVVPAWDNVLFDSPSLGYVIATHQKGRSIGPTVLTYYFALTDSDPKQARQKLLSATREEWIDVILADLGRAHPDLASLTERIDLYRWGHGMIRPRPGFVWGPARRRAARTAFDRIHFAASDLSGVALLEEAQFHGVRAAEQVLRRFGGSVESWL